MTPPDSTAAELSLWESCPKCIAHYRTSPGLVLAFASVGIEEGKSSFQMAEAYFAQYHKGGHKP